MQKQTSLYIPAPCHEDWNTMTPTQQGKFCGSCNKQVVDFSLMSDKQILNVLSSQSGKLCGRFDAEQLQRPLVETKIKKKKSWWMALTMPLLFLFDRSEAQKNIPIQKHSIAKAVHKQNILVGDVEATIVADTIQPSVDSGLNEQLTGKFAICESTKVITVRGKVVDEHNNPLAYAIITQKGTTHGITTDSLGNFSININSLDSSVMLAVSYVGYETIEKQVKSNESEIIIRMLPKSITLSDVVVTGGSFTTGKMVTLGGAVAVCIRINPIDTIKTAIKKALNISAFKIHPNPVIKGSAIHLEIKQAGEYQIQLFDNQSRLIKVEEINTVSGKTNHPIQLPSNIAAGIYYLRLIDEKTKKSNTEKLIIQ